MAQALEALKYNQSNYKIQGQLLIEVPRIFQLGNSASDPDITKLTEEAVKWMNSDFKGVGYVELDISDLGKNQPLGYSNLYRRWALGTRARELYGKDSEGREIQLLTPAPSELALKEGTLPDAKSTYEDLAVAVYSTKGPNAQLAQHLVSQAKERGMQVEFPMVFYHLKTVKDDSFENGLRLDFDDIGVGYPVPILSKETGKFDSNDPELIKTGFPRELGEGSRTLYTRKDGLSRVCRYRSLNLYAVNDYLPNSIVAGRVSFIKGVAPQNLDAALKAIETEKRRQEGAISPRFEQAMKLMKG